MTRVAPIDLAYNPRTLWFDPQDLDIRKGDGVIVTTARGKEFGRAASDIIEITDEQVSALKSPLKPVIRVATPEDEVKNLEMERLGREALPVFREMAARVNDEMHPVAVEYLFSGDKAVFYFEAENRIDFRDLVHELASKFHVRIDMRQIGVRDEARMIGGLGHCGQELCCKRLGGEFCPVTIRMAKEQDLSLNPTKISGICGRLMCCLRYEYEAYKDFKSRAPKANATVQTPDGPGKVTDLDVPREIVSVKVGDEKPVKVPLADFEPAEDGGRPTSVDPDAWKRLQLEATSPLLGSGSFLTSQFTGTDKVAEAGKVRRVGSSSEEGKKRAASKGSTKPSKSATESGRRQRRSSSSADTSKASDESTRKMRRRRSTKVSAEGEATTVVAKASATGNAPAADATEEKHSSHRRRRSSARKPQEQEAAQRETKQKEAPKKRNEGASEGEASKPTKTRHRTRGGRSARSETKGAEGEQASRTNQKSGAAQRPGQKSSGLRGQGGAQEKAESLRGKPGNGAGKPGSDAAKPGSDAAKPGSDAAKAHGASGKSRGEDASAAAGEARRRPRRRRRSSGSGQNPESGANAQGGHADGSHAPSNE